MDEASFEQERPRLTRLAYRLLGSVQGAEDVVQEAALRFTHADDVHVPGAWCTTVVTRLCLDELRSARTRRETYVGPWLPEPVVEGRPGGTEDVPIAFLALLERLAPPQRAAYVLRELFDEDYDDVARVLELTPANARQLVHRAREQLGRPPRYALDPDRSQALVAAFAAACTTGDLETLRTLLAEDVIAMADTAGEIPLAGRHPVLGSERVARLYLGLVGKVPPGLVYTDAWINGQPGVLWRLDGKVWGITAFEVRGDRITSVLSVLASGKLTHLA